MVAPTAAWCASPAAGRGRNINAEVDKLLAAQSRELDKDKRRDIVWQIERLLAEDAARPSIVWQTAANCWQPYVKGFRPHDNSQYNNLRWEDVWLDK